MPIANGIPSHFTAFPAIWNPTLPVAPTKPTDRKTRRVANTPPAEGIIRYINQSVIICMTKLKKKKLDESSKT
jgi:hypothetical protein